MRDRVKMTVKFAIYEESSAAAYGKLSVKNSTLTRTSGAALIQEPTSMLTDLCITGGEQVLDQETKARGKILLE